MQQTGRWFAASTGANFAVAAQAPFEDAMAELSAEAMALLWRVHDGDARDARTAARALLARLAEAPAHERAQLRAWQSNITTWRALARLAGADVPWM
jgi:hypothetical protein